MLSRFLPSKKLLIVFGVIFFSATVVFLFSKFHNRKTLYFLGQQNVAKGEIQPELRRVLIQNDADGDGLKDWEEILWKTDPRNADTDGDGTADNEEILANRNPLLPGPDDQKAEILIKNATAIVITEPVNSNLTQTDLVARELFTGYLLLKQNNQLDTEQQEELIQNIVQNNLNALENSARYTVADLNLTADNSPETLTNFVRQHIIATSLGRGLEDDDVIVKNALVANDQSKLAELDANVGIYREIVALLLVIAVPSDLAELHLNLINEIEALIKNALQMRTIFEDPISGLVSMQAYAKNKTALRDETHAIEIYLAENNVQF